VPKPFRYYNNTLVASPLIKLFSEMLNFSKTTSFKQQNFVKEILNLLEYLDVFHFSTSNLQKQNKILRHHVELAICTTVCRQLLRELVTLR
jgi:uncharacterized membrane protein (DUF373 family)